MQSIENINPNAFRRRQQHPDPALRAPPSKAATLDTPSKKSRGKTKNRNSTNNKQSIRGLKSLSFAAPVVLIISLCWVGVQVIFLFPEKCFGGRDKQSHPESIFLGKQTVQKQDAQLRHSTKYKQSYSWSIILGGKNAVQKPTKAIPLDKDSMEPDFGGLKHNPQVSHFGDHVHTIWDFSSDPILLPREIKNPDIGGYVTDDEVALNVFPPHECRKTGVAKEYHRPVCNMFQELGLEGMLSQDRAKVVSLGSFVEVITVQNPIDEKFVFKGAYLSPSWEYGHSRIEYGRLDATIAASVSPHPLFVTSYGYCGIAVMQEVMEKGDLEHHVYPGFEKCKAPLFSLANATNEPLVMGNKNNITVMQKLKYALDMAEALAMLHNHPMGVIVHGDIWLGQYLLGNDGGIKLNDFNFAEALQFDEQRNMYCPYESRGSNEYDNAPEERTRERAGPERDIYRLGNGLYSLLTGMDLFPHVCTNQEKISLLEKGEGSYIDPRWSTRSVGERGLVELIRKCWRRKIEERPVIGEVIQVLRDLVVQQQHENENRTQGLDRNATTIPIKYIYEKELSKTGDQEYEWVEDYSEYEWKDLPEDIRKDYIILGYTTKEIWDRKRSHVSEKAWENLIVAERAAAEHLGYDKELWEEERQAKSGSHDSSSHQVEVPKKAVVLGKSTTKGSITV